ncbi:MULTISPECIES: cell surface protein [unclassified Vibrio]|uniref:VapA family S-layer protein n=1 Tax=unclassified Vibrio TaxID=2614977 RepID=UPI0025554E49|nr:MULTISPECIES: cell surface protein [unclassified Vibrio]MDK9775102.1 cell surface protein [Vibrio sp. D401a]MDK9807768.1 cell surface protein [Vibrio sp. D406a]
MLKKTLLAASVAAFAAAPAMADVTLFYGNNTADTEVNTTYLASVTKQPVLSFSTAEEQVGARFGVTGDLKQNGFITIELTGDATFNENEVRQWLTDIDAADADSLDITIGLDLYQQTVANNALTGVPTAVVNPTLSQIFKVIPASSGYQLDYAIDLDGKRLRLALKQTIGSFDDLIALSAPKTAAEVDTAAAANVALAADVAALATAGVTGTLVDGDGSTTTGYKFSDTSGTATTAAEKVAYIRANATGGTDDTYLEGLAGFAEGDSTVAAAGTTTNFDFANANQIFNLKTGSSDVKAKIGALKNASYSADPKSTGSLFQLGELFKLALTDADSYGKATALVSTGFTGVFAGSNAGTVVNDLDISADGLKLINRTSNQNIQLNKVRLTLNGDLSAFAADDSGMLLTKSGTTSDWKLSSDKKSATALANVGTGGSSGVLQGEDDRLASVAFTTLEDLYVATDNDIPVEAQVISMTASILGAEQDTFENYSNTLEQLFLITRDGLKFDTILTGTTSSNTVHIRDVSGNLPVEGGKIYVTVWEYDAHEAGENAERNVLAEREELAVKLPSNGAVTLSPATIAAQLGIEVAPARQARMLFEVETNVGEVAVKKSDGKGTDIQVGSQAQEKEIVDFTL